MATVRAVLDVEFNVTGDADEATVLAALAESGFAAEVKNGLAGAIRYAPNNEVACIDPMGGGYLYATDLLSVDCREFTTHA